MIPEWFVTLARDCTVVAGFITAVTVLARFSPLRRPVRYVWRHLVSEPIRTWLRKELVEVLEERGGCTTPADLQRELEKTRAELVAAVAARDVPVQPPGRKQ